MSYYPITPLEKKMEKEGFHIVRCVQCGKPIFIGDERIAEKLTLKGWLCFECRCKKC